MSYVHIFIIFTFLISRLKKFPGQVIEHPNLEHVIFFVVNSTTFGGARDFGMDISTWNQQQLNPKRDNIVRKSWRKNAINGIIA